MAKKSYYEGWGFNDTVKVVLKGTTAQRNKFFTEFKRVFPKEQIEKSGNEVVEVYVYDNDISKVKKLGKLFDLKATYNDGGRTDQSIAQTILQQLGGMGRLVVMTGAYNFVAVKNGVSFKIKNRKVNYIKITLNGKDLYDIEFGRIAVGKLKVTAEHNDIYFDQLIPIFEKETGMYLRLFKKGGFVSTQNRDMVLGQLKSIHHHEEELKNALKTSGEIEAWVLAKVQRATTDLSDVTHYLDGKTTYKFGGKTQGKFIVAYYDDRPNVSNKEDGYQVVVQFYLTQDEDEDYIDEDYIITKSPEEAENLASEINSYGYKEFQPKYAKGGEIESFVYEDVEYPESKTEIDDDEIDDFIENWNDKMETNYSSWEDFNKGEKYYKLNPIKEYATGGKIDLFEDYTKIPRVVQRILDKYSEELEDGDWGEYNKVIDELEKVGYTFDYAMSGEIYGLRPIGVHITELRGYEDFAKGGKTKGLSDDEALHSLLFENGGMPMPQGISVADANPYIAGAKAIQGIAPQSVSALDQRIARKLNPDPNRPVFFSFGGKVGDAINFKGFDGEVRTGTITEDLGGGNFAVHSGFSQVLVNSENFLSFGTKPIPERKKFLGLFENGGVVGEKYEHKYSKLSWGEIITIELIEPTKKGWKVIQTTIKKGKPKTKQAYFTTDEINELFVKI